MKAVSFILLFLLLVMYVFAIIFTSHFGEPGGDEEVPLTPEQEAMQEEVEALGLSLADSDATAVQLFATIGHSMMTLFTNGVLGDNLAQTLNSIKAGKGGYF